MLTRPDTHMPKPSETGPSQEKKGLFSRLLAGMAKTRHTLTEGLATLFSGPKKLDADLLEQIETSLLLSDMGIETTQELITQLKKTLSRRDLTDAETVLSVLQENMNTLLAPCQQPLVFPENIRPFVILVAGVNGAGKTTTIGKLAVQLKTAGKSVMLAAGDTFRAAAIEQLQVWGKRHDIPVIAQAPGADPAAVIHDAFSSAKARRADVLIADTAGRLHTQSHLMEELKKIRRVLSARDPTAPHETLLVLDAGTGQNALNQASQFHEAIGVTGLVLTKLDGTARGGMLFALAKKLALPVRYVGVGEAPEDLQPFDRAALVAALFGKDAGCSH